MKIIVDITCMQQVSYTSGIQRVVKSVLGQWLPEHGDEIMLVEWEYNKKKYKVLDAAACGIAAAAGSGLAAWPVTDTGKKYFALEDFDASCILFEMDSVWWTDLKRSYLLPLIKERGAKIVTQVYDILPITQTRFCDEKTIYYFVECMCAQIKYADLMITNTQAVADEITALCKETDTTPPRFCVVPLASDFAR